MLIVEAEERLRGVLAALLTRAGLQAEAVCDPLEAMAAANAQEVDVALIDLDLPRFSGLALLDGLKRRPEAIEVIVIAGPPLAAAALEAVRRGAYDAFAKPLADLAPVQAAVRRAADRKQLVARNRELERLVSLRSTIECDCVLHLDYAAAKRLAVSTFETSYLLGVLQLAGGNITRAATRAGLDRSNFRRLLKHNNLAHTAQVE